MTNLNFTDLDKLIFLFLFDHQLDPVTTCTIAKNCFTIEDKYDLIQKTNKIMYRLKYWIQQDLIQEIKLKKKRFYVLNVESVYFDNVCLKITDECFNLGKMMVFKLFNGTIKLMDSNSV